MNKQLNNISKQLSYILRRNRKHWFCHWMNRVGAQCAGADYKTSAAGHGIDCFARNNCNTNDKKRFRI